MCRAKWYNMGEADETIGDSSVHVIRGGGVCVGAVEVPTLPLGEYADTEVATNVALSVSAARLERMSTSPAAPSAETGFRYLQTHSDANVAVRFLFGIFAKRKGGCLYLSVN